MEISIIKKSIGGVLSLIFIGMGVCSSFAFLLPAPVHAATALSKPPNNLGLMGYWPLNEATSTIAGDFSGKGNSGTLSGATPPTWVAGKRGAALNFAGATNWVNAGNDASLNITGAVTVCAWVKPTSINSLGIINVIAGRNDAASTKTQYQLYLGGGASTHAGFQWYDDVNNLAGYETLSTDVSLNVWQHVCGVRVNTSSALVYVDGVAKTTSSPGGAVTVSTGATVNRIGSADAGGSSGIFFGAIDEVRIYNRALSASEILALAQTGALRLGASSKVLTQGTTLTNGLTGLWTFDGGDVKWTSSSAGTAFDSSGSNHVGTLTSMTQNKTPAQGRLGQALNTSGGYVLVANPSGFNFGTADFSWAMWLKPYVSGPDVGIMSKADNTTWTTSGKALNYLNSGVYFDAFGIGGTPTVGTLPINEWTHVAITFNDTTNTLLTYVNGVQVDSSVIALTADGGADVVKIGDCCGNGGFPGAMDDVRTYNRVLTPAEVTQLYKIGTTKVR